MTKQPKLKDFEINYEVVSVRGLEYIGSCIEKARNKTEAKKNWLSRNNVSYMKFKRISEIK